MRLPAMKVVSEGRGYDCPKRRVVSQGPKCWERQFLCKVTDNSGFGGDEARRVQVRGTDVSWRRVALGRV